MHYRNIYISYFLVFCKNTWFWLGIWIFYYLKFTDYAGIGIIEAVLIITTTLAEIPTGAVADLLGKRNTLVLAFLFEAVGAFMMAFTPSFFILALSVFVMCIGGAFYSGTIDAIIYDTLKENGNENKYDQAISHINTISLIAPAICSIAGGYMYKVSPSLPFIGNAIGYSFGCISSIFLREPKIDTIKFSFSNFFRQTQMGLKELTKSSEIKRIVFLLLSIGFFVVIASEMLDSFLGFEFGFSEKQLGVLWSVIFIFSSIASLLTPFIIKRLSLKPSIFFVGIFIAVTFLISPIIGLVVGGIVLTFRASLEAIFNNLASVVINQNTESKYRATTLSTFNMIKNVPYLLSAYFIGSISDHLSAKTTALYLGVALMILIILQLPLASKSKLES